MKQLLPLEKAPFHLRPKLPLAPMRSMITYSYPEHSLDHNYFICAKRCNICASYNQLFHTKIAIPFTPCSHLRMVYLLHHRSLPHTYYVGQSGATPMVTNQPHSNHRIKAHLRANPEVMWQILCLISIDFRTPTRMSTAIELKMIRSLRKGNPDDKILSCDPAQFFQALAQAPPPSPLVQIDEA